MAGQKFQYDESGSTFLYFLISFLGLVLVPCTFYFGPADVPEVKVESKDKDLCGCDGCQMKIIRLKKPERWKGVKKNIQRLVLLIGWCFMAFLVYKVQEFDYEYANFDPYDILGVGLQASAGEIKRAYRRLSLIYHPDKSTGDEKKFMKLNKAYQALTDDTARRNYELYGNPDGPGAMNFGIALPSWIIEKENSIWVLGVYALIFMIGLPTVVAIWWYRSSKFCNDQVLLDTTQLYYYFFHKTPQMVFKRALMILAASLEYDKGHNSEVNERHSDNFELPSLMKSLPYMGEKNKERPLCFPYSMKARALFCAHLARIPLNRDTLDQDRLYIVKLAPALINEMVSCVSQLIMLAHAGRISRLPSLETIEATMKLSPHVVQALNESKSHLLQLPHIKEDMLRIIVSKKRSVKTLHHFISLHFTERRNILRHLTEEQTEDVFRVCRSYPLIDMEINYEVVDDDDSGVFTAGAIVTVTVLLHRSPLEEYFNHKVEVGSHEEVYYEEPKDKKASNVDKDSGWKNKGGKRRPQVKNTRKKASNQTKGRKEEKHPNKEAEMETKLKTSKDRKPDSNKVKTKSTNNHIEDLEVDSESDYSISHSDESEAEEADTESHRDEKMPEDDDLEWEKFQRGLTKREKVLEGKSKLSHPVHCPLFTVDKQEYWWIYICDRKRRMLITAPYQVTNLVNEEEVQLKFTAPMKPGVYTFQVCVRSDSYVGFDVNKDIKLDVKEAREIPTAHPQWEEFSSEEDANLSDKEDGEGNDNDSEFATDSDFSYDSD